MLRARWIFTATVLLMAAAGLITVGFVRADHETLYTLYGDSMDRFGDVVSGAGDINADGYDDLIVCAPYADIGTGTSNEGYVYLVSGKNGTALYSLPGEVELESYGSAAGAAGDVNADGYDDVILGSFRWFIESSGVMDMRGIARVVSGKDGTSLYEFKGAAEQRLGTSVNGAGDVNADGYDDVIVGCAGPRHRAFVYSGKNGSTLYTFYADVNDDTDDRFADAVSGAGDVNNDGYDDFIVGAYGDDDNGSGCGSARVYSGKDGTTLYTFYGDSAGDQLGRSVRGAGDVNNDGYDDVIVGAPYDDDNGSACGSARVYSGKNGATLYTFYGDAKGDALGMSVSGAGDVNEDGYDDLVAGAPRDDDNGSASGSVRVYSGRDGSVLSTHYGKNPGEQMGLSVSGAGDIDKDGLGDIIAGAPLDDTYGTNSGKAYVLVSGSADAPPSIALTAPADGGTVVGSTVALAATASDDRAVAKVEFFLDGGLLGTDTTSPYGLTWDSTTATDGSHIVTAKATDDAGQTASDTAYITVRNATAETLAKDDFESGGFSGGTGAWVGGWITSGDVSMRKSKDGPHSGNNHVRLRRNTGWLERKVNLSGATSVKLVFWAKVRSFESSDKAYVKVSSDGQTYTTVKTFTYSDSDNTYHKVEIDLSGSSMTSAFRIVFDAQMSGRRDYLYLDDIELVGVAGQ